MYIVGVGLVRPLQPWNFLLIYCNNHLKTYIAPLLRLGGGGALHPPSDVYVRSFLCLFFTLIKLCYTKSLEWSSLIPGPKAKSSSEITYPASFTISYQFDIWMHIANLQKCALCVCEIQWYTQIILPHESFQETLSNTSEVHSLIHVNIIQLVSFSR